MRLVHRGTYPEYWLLLAAAIKKAAGFRCIRCQRGHDPEAGYCLTVHHMDGDKGNDHWWNLLALCQRCHLIVQAKVIPDRPYLFEHADWFKPYVAGYYAFTIGGVAMNRHQIEWALEHWLHVGQPWLPEQIEGTK